VFLNQLIATSAPVEVVFFGTTVTKNQHFSGHVGTLNSTYVRFYYNRSGLHATAGDLPIEIFSDNK